MVGDELVALTPPPFSAVLATTVQFTIVGDAPSWQAMPPPSALSAELPVMTQLAMVGDPPPQNMPPPDCSAELPLIVQLRIVGDEPSRYTPPPHWSLVAPPLASPPVTTNPSRVELSAPVTTW